MTKTKKTTKRPTETVTITPDRRTITTHYLRRGESVADPTTTSGRRIHGPAVVTMTQWLDGGINVVVRKGNAAEGQNPWPSHGSSNPEAAFNDDVAPISGPTG